MRANTTRERSGAATSNRLLRHSHALLGEALRSPSQPLDHRTRAFMESRFGHDFSRVRVHNDQRAAEAADAVGAHAFTIGDDLVFGAAEFAPHTHAGKRLLAHELGHVVQQERGAPRRIQRSAKFVKTKPNENINPAEQIGENVIPTADLYLGQTHFLLNGTSFTGATVDQMTKALKKPTIGHADTTIQAGKDKTVPAFECWFDSVPDNVGSYEMNLLKQGTWKHITAKSNLGARFPSLRACKEGFGDVTFVVNGDPDDETVRKKVQAHEKVHADDDEAVFNDLLGAWDKEIAKQHKDKTKKKRLKLPDCEAAPYSFGGKDNSPDKIVVEMAQAIAKKASDFHKTAAGAKPSTTPEKPDSECTVLKARTGY